LSTFSVWRITKQSAFVYFFVVSCLFVVCRYLAHDSHDPERKEKKAKCFICGVCEVMSSGAWLIHIDDQAAQTITQMSASSSLRERENAGG